MPEIKTFKKRPHRRWTEPELNMLRSGKIPKGRTYGQCCQKADMLGIKRPMSPTGRHMWTPDEEQAIREGRIPEGRTFRACFTHGYGMGLRLTDNGDGTFDVRSMDMPTVKREALMARAGILYQLHKEGLSLNRLANLIGVTNPAVSNMLKKYRESVFFEAEKKKSEKRIKELIKQLDAFK